MGSISKPVPMEHATHQSEVEGCRHFSIRGYVAGMREKDRKKCWPFTVEEQGDELPPIRVPNFRYWRCSLKTADTCKEDNVARCNLPNGRLIPSEDFNMPPSRDAAPMLLLDSLHASQDGAENNTPLTTDMKGCSHQAVVETILDENIADVGATIDTNKVENNTALSLDLQVDSRQALREDVCKENTPLLTDTRGNETEAKGDAIDHRRQDVVMNEIGERSEDVQALIVNRDLYPPYLRVDMRHNRKPRLKRNNLKRSRNQTSIEASGFEVPMAVNQRYDEGERSISINENVIRPRVSLGKPPRGRKEKKSRRLGDILKCEDFLMCNKGRDPNEDDNVDYVNIEENNVDLNKDDVDHGDNEDDIVEIETEEYSVGSDRSLGIDLNLSPTHQLLPKSRKVKPIEDKEEASLEIRKKKGKMPLYEQTGGESVFLKPVQDGSNEASMAGQINGGEILLHINRNSSSSSDHQPKNTITTKKPRTQLTSEQAVPDDIPMDIVELLAKHQHERNLGVTLSDSNQTDKNEDSDEILRDLQKKKRKRVSDSSSHPEPEPSGFTAFAPYQEKKSDGPQLLKGCSSRNTSDREELLRTCRFLASQSQFAKKPDNPFIRPQPVYGYQNPPCQRNGYQNGHQRHRYFQPPPQNPWLPWLPSGNSNPQCLELFPNGGGNGIHHTQRIQSQFNPMPPVGLYNKETMPATDLLRMMDAGIRPNAPTPLNVDRNHKFIQHPHFNHPEMSRFGPSSSTFNRYHHPGKFPGNFPSIPIPPPSLPERGRYSLAIAKKDTPKPVEKAKISPGKKTRKFEYCYMSRNPADFSLPEPGSPYMRRSGDIKLKENVSPRKKTGMPEPLPIPNKRQKKAKFAVPRHN